MSKSFLISIAILFVSISVIAQPKTEIGYQSNEVELDIMQAYEDSLFNLAAGIKDKILFQDRLKACYDFIPAVVTALKQPNSFYYDFENLDFISNVYAPDSTFRIMTWLMKINENNFRYFGALQLNSKELKMYPFFDLAEPLDDPWRSTVSLDKWYGCLYYNIVKQSYKGKDAYVLFGWDGNNLFSRKKIVDILSVNQEGQPTLGMPIFELNRDGKGINTYNRLIFEYKSNATVTVNFDEDLDMIVFDHLVPEDGKAFGLYATYIPDGTYEALKFEKGKFKYVEKVFHQTQDEPPIPKPLFENKGDIPVNLPGN